MTTREDALKELYALAGISNRGDAGAVEREIIRVTSPAAAVEAAPAQSNTAATSSRIGEQLAVITTQLDLLRTAQQTQADAVAENTKAIVQSVASRVGQTAASTATGLLGGFGLSPIVSGLLKLFGGGKSDGEAAVAAPVKYAAPAAMDVQAGLTGGQLTEASYGAGDRVRAVPNITVQVQAMDSRSFLDRSDDIAKAVRQAMLESHAINDVVQEL